MSTKDQALSAALHGEALLAAQDPTMQPLLDRLAALPNGHDDARLETAGRIAGGWFGAMDSDAGHELIAAGLLILAGPFDGDRLAGGLRRGINESPARSAGLMSRWTTPARCAAASPDAIWAVRAPASCHVGIFVAYGNCSGDLVYRPHRVPGSPLSATVIPAGPAPLTILPCATDRCLHVSTVAPDGVGGHSSSCAATEATRWRNLPRLLR